MSTHNSRGHAEDADDPLPYIDQQLGVGHPPDAGHNRDRYLKWPPLLGIFFASVLLLGGAAGAVVFSPNFGSSPGAPPGAAATDQAPTNKTELTASAPGTTRLDVPSLGYSVDYPSAWTKVDSTDTGTPVEPESDGVSSSTVVRISGDDAFSIKTFGLERPVAKPQLSDMRAVTDAILSSPEAGLTVLDVRATEVGGLPAVYYLYYFPSGKQQGIHAHYFVFDGARMHSMVFQVVPAPDFPKYAADFDAVVASFKATQ